MERILPERILSQPTRIILRNLERRPVKAFLSVTGIALACAIMIIGGFFEDTVNHMVDIQFRMSHREDMTVTFIEATSLRSLYELKGLAGVEHAEPFRSVPVRFRNGHLTYRSGIRGVAPDSRLYRLLDQDLREVTLPREGVVLTQTVWRAICERQG